MIKLLRANFCRLRKDILFYISTIANTVLWAMYSDNEVYFDSFFLILQPVVYSIFIAFYIGKEYGNGTLRNKLICGHTRLEVYFAYLFTCIFASLVSVLPGIVIFVVKNYAFLSVIKPITLLMLFLGFVLLNCACCTVFTAVSFNISSKAICIIVVALVAFCGMIASEYIYQWLMKPETRLDVEITENYEIIEKGRIPNPDYVGGVPRKILLGVFNMIPQAQLIEYGDCLSSWKQYDHSGQFDYNEYSSVVFKDNNAVYRDFHYGFVLNQLAVIFISGFAGYVFFKRKNLK